jgi:hypothetical protein
MLQTIIDEEYHAIDFEMDFIIHIPVGLKALIILCRQNPDLCTPYRLLGHGISQDPREPRILEFFE